MDRVDVGGRPERPGARAAGASALRLARGAALVAGVVTMSAPALSGPGPRGPERLRPEAPSPALGAGASDGAPAAFAKGAPASVAARSVADDPRVLAFLEAYGALVDSVTYLENDAVFHMGRFPIHFSDGRMLAAHRLDHAEACGPIFYPYSLEPLTEPPPPPPPEPPTSCADAMESLWGTSEHEIRAHGRRVTFLDHRMFVNSLLVERLAAVERELRGTAARNPEVARWIEELAVTYSFMSRDIAGTTSPSRHAFGLAVDLAPRSYRGRHVYWRWSRALDREGWWRIPLERRWSPPASVVRTFERHGFVWGGKWSHFDAIHFEYRPEILAYSRLTS